MINESQLRVISIGIVAKDILEDDLYVDISPIEIRPSADGELTDGTEEKAEITSMAGSLEHLKVIQSGLIKAKWLADGDTNRLEPPTVCKGELVRIYQYADSDEHYWSTLYNQLDHRKLEKRTIVVSNKASIDVPPEDLLKHSYYLLMDSINKLVHLHLSKTDGEYTEYDVAFDTKEGKFEFTDDKDNHILLESQDDRLTISINKEIIVNTKDRYANISNNNTEKVDNDEDITIGNDQTESIGNNRTTDITNDDALTVGNNKKDVITSKYEVEVKSFSLDNGSDELIKVLTDFVQTVSDGLGVGNANVPVPLDGGTKSALADIKSRLAGFFH